MDASLPYWPLRCPSLKVLAARHHGPLNFLAQTTAVALSFFADLFRSIRLT
ncbi:hypothetical protein GGQ85_003997 [Nitrobacter vulgaris]|nr:hypothetical protein [Nitrobacter vulgaris]